MASAIIYQDDEGNLIIVRPIVHIDMVLSKDIPQTAKNIVIIDDTMIPEDRTFRDAWEIKGKNLIINMDKAKAILLDRIRQVRNIKLDLLDKDWMAAYGQGKTQLASQIEAQRQVLRDIPQTINLNAAANADELKAIWPFESME